MHQLCEELHLWANALPRVSFPFDPLALPLNGLYLLFEKGETAHDTTRIVRVGTHTGNDQLRSLKAIERRVSDYIQTSFSFAVLGVNDKRRRLRFESRLISTLSLCETCHSSTAWLGLFSPKEKIRESGLWLVNELYRQ